VDKVEELEESQLASLTHIFAEPYFMNAILPWDNFYFGTLLLKIKDRLPEGVKISPCSARIYALPVEFLDLHKIRAPVGSCEGFDLRLFDEMVEVSFDTWTLMDLSDDIMIFLAYRDLLSRQCPWWKPSLSGNTPAAPFPSRRKCSMCSSATLVKSTVSRAA